MRELRVLVVGGGIGGLSTAIALAREGARPELVEARAEWPADGAGIVLHPNGVRALRRLGVGRDLDAAAAVVPRWSFCDAHGDVLCSTDLAALWGGVAPCLGITRGRLLAILQSAAGPVVRRLGMRLTALAQEGDTVHTEFSDGTAGRYDLVVGADGIRSTVRRLALDPASPRYCGLMGWRAVVPVRLPGVTHLVLLLGDGRFVGLAPVRGGTYGFAGLAAEAPIPDPSAGRLERLRARFAGLAGPAAALFEALQADAQIHGTPIEAVDLDRWHAGRMVLVGDAAHAAPPHMGQGGCLAVEDAVVLADELHGAAGVDAALDRFVARRRPRVVWVQQQSREAAQAWVRPAAVRDATLRERGDALLRARYAPLRALP